MLISHKTCLDSVTPKSILSEVKQRWWSYNKISIYNELQYNIWWLEAFTNNANNTAPYFSGPVLFFNICWTCKSCHRNHLAYHLWVIHSWSKNSNVTFCWGKKLSLQEMVDSNFHARRSSCALSLCYWPKQKGKSLLSSSNPPSYAPFWHSLNTIWKYLWQGNTYIHYM